MCSFFSVRLKKKEDQILLAGVLGTFSYDCDISSNLQKKKGLLLVYGSTILPPRLEGIVTEMGGHIMFTFQEQRINRKWSQVVQTQSLPPGNHFLQQGSTS